MKTKIMAGFLLAGILVVTCSFTLKRHQSRGNSGIYLTVQDYYQHKLTYEFDGNSEDGKLILNDLLGNSSGYVVNKGEKHPFDKNKTYGYQNRDNKVYRFFGKEAYEIIDTAQFYLYYRYDQVEKVKGKELVKTDEYYFSKDAGSQIQLLTVDNLKKAFPNNLSFHYSIDALFRTDQELIAYDTYCKCYKLKYIFSQSLK